MKEFITEFVIVFVLFMAIIILVGMAMEFAFWIIGTERVEVDVCESLYKDSPICAHVDDNNQTRE